jgi:small subunit ribosomal protein S9
MEKAKGTSNFHGVGRRKSSVARVWLKPGKGEFVVNKRNSNEYFTTEITRKDIKIPFDVSGLNGKFDVLVNVVGGGVCSQAGAVRLGVARALLSSDESLRKIFRRSDLLTVDSRVKERKKPGQKGARAKFQFVKR